jgi:hypothetical protein
MAQGQESNNGRSQRLVFGNLLAVLLFILIIGGVLYLQFTRYALVGKAIDAKDASTAALALSPEISLGLANLLI